MKKKRLILAVVLAVVALVAGILSMLPAVETQNPTTVSFIGFSNALPFAQTPKEIRSLRAVLLVTNSSIGFSNALPLAQAPEEIRSLHAVFLVTNHMESTMDYHSEVHGVRFGGKGSSMMIATDALPGHGSGTFMLSTDDGSNGWTFLVVNSSSRSRSGWQNFCRKLSKQFHAPPIFNGPSSTYPKITNTWTTPGA